MELRVIGRAGSVLSTYQRRKSLSSGECNTKHCSKVKHIIARVLELLNRAMGITGNYWSELR
jgi:hypothetical protein